MLIIHWRSGCKASLNRWDIWCLNIYSKIILFLNYTMVKIISFYIVFQIKVIGSCYLLSIRLFVSSFFFFKRSVIVYHIKKNLQKLGVGEKNI